MNFDEFFNRISSEINLTSNGYEPVLFRNSLKTKFYVEGGIKECYPNGMNDAEIKLYAIALADGIQIGGAQAMRHNLLPSGPGYEWRQKNQKSS